MKEKIERTLFFVKPDSENPGIDKATALEIIAFLEDRLKEKSGSDFKRVLCIRTPKMPREFYLDFYSQLRKDWPEVLEKMSAEFANKSLAAIIYEGPDIIQRVKDIVGSTRYWDNAGKGTIREKFGNQDMMYRTVVHASDKEGRRKDFIVFKKWKLIPPYL